MRLVRMRMSRELRVDEADAVAAAIDEALSLLQTGGAAARGQLLAMDLADALVVQAGAWVWAVAVEASASNTPTAAAIAAAIVDGASAVAAMLFTRAAVVFGMPTAVVGESEPCIVQRHSARQSPSEVHSGGATSVDAVVSAY